MTFFTGTGSCHTKCISLLISLSSAQQQQFICQQIKSRKKQPIENIRGDNKQLDFADPIKQKTLERTHVHTFDSGDQNIRKIINFTKKTCETKKKICEAKKKTFLNE